MVRAQETEELVGRELLLDVACRLFMEDGFDGVSMQQIASAAHMTKGSPYYHFKGKDDLFLHAFAAQVKRVNAGIVVSLAGEGPLRERLVAGFTHLIRTTDPGMMRMLDDFWRLFKGQACAADVEFEATPEVMRRAYAELFVASGESFRQPPAVLADALMAFQLGTVHMQMADPESRGTPMTDADARQIAETTIDLFLNGATLPAT